MKTMRKTTSVLLALVLVLAVALSASPAVFADGDSTTPVSGQLTVAEGAYLSFKEGETLQLSATGLENAILGEYEWKKDDTSLKNSSDKRIQILNGTTLVITNLKTSDSGKYEVSYPKGSAPSYKYEVVVNVTSKDVAASGGIEILGYSVQDAAGNEIQKVTPGTKCRIVVAVRDGRITTPPTQLDNYGNTINIKLSSTTSFSSPTFGDLKQTNAQMSPDNTGYEYGIVFNDITYVGGDNTLTFDLSYNDNSVPMTSLSVVITQCQTDSQTGAKPTLMVQNINYGGQSIEAGKTFTLSITSYNTSKESGLTDVTTSISLPAGLMLAEGSNKVLTPSVAAGGAYTTTFQMQADSSAETGPVNVTVDYTYYLSGTSEPMSASQMITIPLVQPDRFSFTTMDVPTEAYAGEESYVSLDFVNKGKGILYNLSAELSGNMDNAGQTQYLGNLQSGTEGSVEFGVLASQAGTVSGVITLTYEDVNGNAKTQTKEFSISVMEMPTYDDYPMDPGMDMPVETGFVMPWWGWLLIVVAGAAVVIVIVRIVKKRKAKKLALELAEDEADEDF